MVSGRKAVIRTKRRADWWRGTARYMWRKYFDAQPLRPDTPASCVRICTICETVMCRLSQQDREIMKCYFTSRWGDDLYTVEECAARIGVPVNVVGIVVSHACRAVIEALGLMERKGGGTP